MTRRLPPALGLRAQIVLALGMVFVLSFALLGLAAVRLTRRAFEKDLARSAHIVGQALAISIEQLGQTSSQKLDTVADDLLARFPGSAVYICRADGTVYQRGVIPSHQGASIPLGDGGRLQLWLSYRPAVISSPLTDLLLFYVALTGVAVMLLTYVALTYWIVRPVESLIRWSEKLARGEQETGVPVRGSAEVMRLAIAFSDLAEQLRAERLALEQRLNELEQTTVELKTTQQQLVHGEKLAMVGRLAAGVAHEIGNPLSAILGLVELLKTDKLQAAEQEEFLERIHAETQRIHGIIRDLLDFSRHGVETEELEMTSDLKRVIDDAVNLVKPLKELRDVKIEVRRPEKLPRVAGPQHRLTQVVLNLILNAADALQGRGAIRIEVGPVEADERITLSVLDDGPGIADEIKDKLFEPFTTTKPVGKGTGLGLAVSHTLIESLGGSVNAYNPPEGGARFDVKLRILPSSSSYPPPRGQTEYK